LQSRQSLTCEDDIQPESSKGKGKKRKVGERLAFARKKTEVEGLMRSLKIRIYPNTKQKNTMKQWLGCAR